MMIYQQQTMLGSAIQPIEHTHATATRTTSKQRQARSVVFCSSTKYNEAHKERSALKRRATSSSVPIPDAMFRSPSELQLSVDEQVADERDFVFYARLMSGIRERNRLPNPLPREPQQYFYNEETERCLTHIMQTRHQQEQPLEENGVPILHDEDLREDVGADGYYLEDLSSSSSYSSTSTYQQDFEHDTCNDDTACFFDLEL